MDGISCVGLDHRVVEHTLLNNYQYASQLIVTFMAIKVHLRN